MARWSSILINPLGDLERQVWSNEIVDFRKSWYTACRLVGIKPISKTRPGLIVHDMRRSEFQT